MSLYCYQNLNQFNSIKNKDQVQLDIVFSIDETIKVSESIDPLLKLDELHPPLDIELSLPTENKRVNSNTSDRTVHCYKIGNYREIAVALGKIDWDHDLGTCNSIDEAVSKFYSIANQLIFKHIPKKVFKDLKFPAWATSEL